MIIALTLVALMAQAAVDVQAGGFGFSSSEASGNDIAALCAGKAIDLTSIAQLEELDRVVGETECGAGREFEIHQLTSAIRKGRADLCSVESIESFINFYKTQIDTSGDNDEELVKPLKRFALAYGSQISNLCKKNMIRVLNEEIGHLIDASDYKEIGKIVEENGPIAQMIGAIGGPDEMFLPASMKPSSKDGGMSGDRKPESEKICLQAETGTYIKKLQSACERSFKPIYDALILPLIQLSNIGINYKDATLKGDLKDQMKAGKTAEWSRIVFLCESLLGIHIVQDNADQEQGVGTEMQLVRILTEEEAAQLEGPQSASDIERIVYVPSSKIILPDLIFDRSDAKLVKAIKKIKTNKSEEQVRNKRLKEQALSWLKKYLSKGQIGVILSTGYKALARKLKHKTEPVASPREALVKALDEMTRQQAAGSEGAVSSSGDYEAEGHIMTILLIVLCIWLAIWLILGLVVPALG